MSDTRHTIRNIDPETVLNARVYALQTGRTLGELVSESLEFFMAEADDEGINESSDDASNGSEQLDAFLHSLHIIHSKA